MKKQWIIALVGVAIAYVSYRIFFAKKTATTTTTKTVGTVTTTTNPVWDKRLIAIQEDTKSYTDNNGINIIMPSSGTIGDGAIASNKILLPII